MIREMCTRCEIESAHCRIHQWSIIIDHRKRNEEPRHFTLPITEYAYFNTISIYIRVYSNISIPWGYATLMEVREGPFRRVVPPWLVWVGNRHIVYINDQLSLIIKRGRKNHGISLFLLRNMPTLTQFPFTLGCIQILASHGDRLHRWRWGRGSSGGWYLPGLFGLGIGILSYRHIVLHQWSIIIDHKKRKEELRHFTFPFTEYAYFNTISIYIRVYWNTSISWG